MTAGFRGLTIVALLLAAGVAAWSWLNVAPDATTAPDPATNEPHALTDASPSRAEAAHAGAPTSTDTAERAPDSGSASVATDSAARVDLDPSRPADATSTAQLEGRVVDDAGRPIGGATVTLSRIASGLLSVPVPLGARAKTNGSGRFQFVGVPPRTPLAIEASATGFAPARTDGITANAGATTTAPDVVLSTGVSVRGRVRSAADGRAVPAARVVARLIRGGVPVDPLAAGVEATADAQGDYALEGLAAETYRFTVTAAEFVDTSVDRSFFAARLRKDAKFDLTLQPSAGALIGRTIDAAGVPLGDVLVVAQAAREDRSTHRIDARSAADGTFALEKLGPWDYVIEATGPHHALKSPVTARAERRTLDLTLSKKARLSGVVRFDAGTGLARIDAALVPRPGATPLLFAQVPVAPDGAFVVDDVPSGSIVLDVASDVGAPTRFGPVDVAAGSDVTGIELHIARGAVAIGRVVSADGQPVAAATVVLLPAAFDVGGNDATLVLLEGTHRKNARCDASGGFTLAGLPEGAYRIRASAPGHAPAHSAVFSTGTTPTIDVGTLRLSAPTVIRGRVVDAQGTPVARAVVRAAAASAAPGGVTASDAAGEFQFDDLAADRWTLSAVVPHGQLGALDLVGEAKVETTPGQPADATIRVARRE